MIHSQMYWLQKHGREVKLETHKILITMISQEEVQIQERENIFIIESQSI